MIYAAQQRTKDLPCCRNYLKLGQILQPNTEILYKFNITHYSTTASTSILALGLAFGTTYKL